ncbi:ComEA family DNA-binding protein [Sphingobacterium deserti]|uniref:DNA uptake protein and related DNA-binding protein-like protein n=1 Tax=Sphingobacterium deserti TaxID=1229276 RepID=A0A0B8T6E3_9SPHI|nr:helix-hairpin-helix domain-containing protein [Sphingobacterium deserti]KGE13589.1 DNA uptake protein and related DNA-binding protein-like protein [Sphingobacterium deserti]
MGKLSVFFRLTQNERRGFMVLLLFSVSIYYMPLLYRYIFHTAPPAEPLISWVDIVPDGPSERHTNDLFFSEKEAEISSTAAHKLSPFNPNNLPASQWKAMGFSDKQIRVIKNYESKGGRFYKAEDVRKIYSISAAEFERIAPFLRFEESKISLPPTASPLSTPKVVKYSLVDINEGDSAAFVALRGIGPVLSSRIIKYRNSLGGFHSIEQLAEVYGLPAETFEKIQGQLLLTANSIKQLSVNTATEAELAAHPYIGKRHATRIVRYRSQHGSFTSLQDLTHIYTLDSIFLRKIEPYLKFN